MVRTLRGLPDPSVSALNQTERCARARRSATERGRMSMINVAKLPVTAAVAMVAVIGIALLSPSSSPSATAQQPGSRLTVTENGVRFSFRVPRGWERLSSIPTNKSPGGPISLNKSVVGSQGAEGIIYWTSFPRRRLRRSVCPSAGPVGWPIGSRSRDRSCDSARHQARQGALGRHPGRAASEVRVAQSSRDSRLRPWVLLQLAIRARR